MAERVGFEPTIPLTVYTLSKRAPRTWRHSHSNFLNGYWIRAGVRRQAVLRSDWVRNLISMLDSKSDL